MSRLNPTEGVDPAASIPHAQRVDGVCVECEQGKHHNCNGAAWDYTHDDITECICTSEEHVTT